MWCTNNGFDSSTLEGQLWFLKYENETDKLSVHNYLLSVPNTVQGAYDAAAYWCLHWEIPDNKYYKAQERGNIARDTYWPQFGV